MTLNSYLWEPIELHGLYGHQPLPPPGHSTVAAAQFTAVPGDPTANLATIAGTLAYLCSSAAHSGDSEAPPIALAVFPEYALTGCPGAVEPVAITDITDWHGRLIDLAQRYGVYLVVGYAEQDGDQRFSSSVLVGPAGIIARYRKTHVIGTEATWCSAGEAKPPIVDLPFGRVGLNHRKRSVFS